MERHKRRKDEGKREKIEREKMGHTNIRKTHINNRMRERKREEEGAIDKEIKREFI